MVGLLNSHNNYKIITLCTVLFYDQDIRKEKKKSFEWISNDLEEVRKQRFGQFRKTQNVIQKLFKLMLESLLSFFVKLGIV